MKKALKMKKALLILSILPLSVAAQNSGLTGRVVDAETGKPVEVSGGSFRVDIPRRNYRIYRIGK